MNQIPAIINTNPPEPKAPFAEMSADMVVESIVPSNNYGKDQFEITAKIEAIDQFYSKKYWILQSMPGAKELQPGQTQTVSLRRRRLQQTREGVVKKGYNDEGRMLNHEWDWEIVAMGKSEVEVNTPQPSEINTPKPIASATPTSSTMTTDMKITRTAMMKSLMENHSKPVDTWSKEDYGQAQVTITELSKIINNIGEFELSELE